ncbi:hypothetical protein FRB96_009405 [Tulasnella sp. 330]|nr:hypothetical protein FRB96_009405 [Tulasnella sp. 330]KAG8884720.1 hypothetical protein FRB97_003504 [Tulasnella sp. 331]KAG8889695.1 hypothetical protein FRB98_003258 [Tulasnella sp. 332]
MSSTLILSAQDVDKLVKEISPKRLIDLMRTVFQTLSASHEQQSPPSTSPLLLETTIQTPHRASIETPKHTTLFMPSRMSSQGTAIKIVSVPKAGGGDGLPATTVVIDEATGGIKAIVNARNLTAQRNAAGSLLATSMFIPKYNLIQEPMTLVCFGAGAQIAAHVRLFLTHYDEATSDRTITRCVIVNRSDNVRLQTLVHDLRRGHPNVRVTSYAFTWDPVATTMSTQHAEVEAAVRSADMIVCATSSETPLFPSSWMTDPNSSSLRRRCCHINLVGSYKPTMCEIDSELVRRARFILVDSKTACAKEAGELISTPGMVVISKAGEPEIVDERVVEIGAFTAPLHDDEGEGGVTIFKSVGVGAQDVAIASLIVGMAEQKHIGIKVPFE